MFRSDILDNALSAIGASSNRTLFAELDDHYGHESRHYHSHVHVSECLRQLKRLEHLAHRPREIEVAIWFHDAIYDTRRDDNEEKSAQWAATYLGRNGANADTVRRIVELILATKTHTTSGEDQALFVDIDLGILGTSKAIFERYDAAIRREYGWVPETQYREGRKKVLASFLVRDKIYQTETLRHECEAIARENIERKISELSA